MKNSVTSVKSKYKIQIRHNKKATLLVSGYATAIFLVVSEKKEIGCGNTLTDLDRVGSFIKLIAGARSVIVIVFENGHGDTSSNPRRDWLHFT